MRTESHPKRGAAWLLAVLLTQFATLSCSQASPGASPSADAGSEALAPEAGGDGMQEAALPCPPGTSLCGSTCVDLSSDTSFCGDCTKSCVTGAQCSAGVCCLTPAGGGACDIYPACGCSAAQNCARIDGGPEQCIANGTVMGMGECQSSADCFHGLTCAHGICNPPCDATSECMLNFLCTIQSSVVNGQNTSLGYAVCLPHCNPVDPLANDGAHVGCLLGQRCEIEQLNTVWTTYCQSSTGTLAQGAACAQNGDCKPGYDCIDDGTGSKTCRQMCRVGFTDCTTGSCVAFAMPKYDTIGAYSQEIGSCQ